MFGFTAQPAFIYAFMQQTFAEYLLSQALLGAENHRWISWEPIDWLESRDGEADMEHGGLGMPY